MARIPPPPNALMPGTHHRGLLEYFKFSDILLFGTYLIKVHEQQTSFFCKKKPRKREDFKFSFQTNFGKPLIFNNSNIIKRLSLVENCFLLRI